ncbi:GNAT family protein [Colletotrichum tofieldiae]|nr:GNAT family protein [Colletotrichum tofieldiae]
MPRSVPWTTTTCNPSAASTPSSSRRLPETFYAAALTGPFSRVITWSDPSSPGVEQVIGGVVCCVEPSPFPPASPDAHPEHALYIRSLALLSPYRSYGLATATIDHLINLRHIYAHVWTDNEEGMHWYAARGFERYGEPLQGYYIKLRPDSAWIVHRAVGPLSIGSKGQHSGKTSAPVPGPTAAVANLPPMGSGPPPVTGEVLSRTPSGQSFQNRRAATEWNDLPEDMASGLLAPPRSNGGSGASSRSSSAVRKKRDRSYPAAAFQG